MNRLLSILIIILLICSVSFAEKGFYVEQQTHTPGMMGQPAKDEISKTWISDTGYRMESGNSIMILRFDSKTVWNIDMEKKTYFEVDAESMKEMAQMGNAMMGNTEENALVFKKSGNKKKIKDWNCYEVSAQNAMMKHTMWLTEDLPYGKEAYHKFYKNVPEFEEMAESIFNSEELKGYPVANEMEINKMGLKIKSSSELISIKEQDIPARMYNLPAGLEKMGNPMDQMKRPGAPKLR